ncbi:enoyl-CoA hydratase-related protein [Janthinobacterium aquaticum]|uniref:enoyl-CoA hydratase-related protein n=1 Tax=Janthinobacterium sp. FT58W TaxID=2654254 RepID=UPI00126507A6|nr:enoyl-CoA hydratase-related protein [Janthinobacterium sp. FT58W]KAB8045154.1 enoyl-CoA hydratase [Janthinobacterium sp. FT58W]
MTSVSSPALPQLHDALLHIDGRVATLTLNRDDVRNELTGTRLVDDIETVAAWINANEAISALVISGAGKAFSAGGNVKHMQNRQGTFGGDVHAVQKQYREGIQRIPLAMHKLEVPVIAAINGAAIGAGFDLACMCDFRLAASDSVMGETFVNMGIIPGDGGAWFLQRLIGYQRAAELTFSGRVFGAAEAQAMGIVLEVLEPAELMPRAQALAASFAAKPPQALRMSKRLMKLAQRQELPDFLDHCAVLQGICHNTQDHLEAVGAFLEKRSAQFVGR